MTNVPHKLHLITNGCVLEVLLFIIKMVFSVDIYSKFMEGVSSPALFKHLAIFPEKMNSYSSMENGKGCALFSSSVALT